MLPLQGARVGVRSLVGERRSCMPHGVTPPKKNTLGKCVLSVQENEAPKGTVGLDLNSGLYVSVEGTAGLHSLEQGSL